MGITHVIRGDDHLSNTPKQILLYKALGWDVPGFAHLPMILDEQKKKLSKRRDTVSVEEYREQGYLPEALFNFLTLLGFAPMDNREIISRDELVKEFTFQRVNKKSAVFDMNKLNWINSNYINSADEKRLVMLLRETLINKEILGKESADNLASEFLVGVIKLMKPRISKISEIGELGKYFFVAPETYDTKGLAKHWNENIRTLMENYVKLLESYDEFPGHEKLELHLRFFSDNNNIKAGQMIHPIRLALTGSNVSPGIFELMQLLGKENTINRLRDFLNKT
jgi:glutamyl-tRNA synthetase